MNWRCLLFGHDVRRVKSDQLSFQKGGKRPTVDYFSGEYMECKRANCDWNRFFGERRAHRRTILINGVEHEIKPDGLHAA